MDPILLTQKWWVSHLPLLYIKAINQPWYRLFEGRAALCMLSWSCILYVCIQISSSLPSVLESIA